MRSGNSVQFLLLLCIQALQLFFAGRHYIEGCLSSCRRARYCYGAVYTLITVQRSVLDSISRTSGELSCLCPLSSSYTPCLPLSHLRLFVCILSCRQSRSGGEFFRPRIVYFAPARQGVEGPCLGREGVADRLSRRKAWIGRLTHGNCNH